MIAGKALIVRKKFTYWLTEILWSLIVRHYFEFTATKMDRRRTIDYHKAAQSLLKWIKTKIPHYKICNITTDLKSGIALCHLINAISPNSVDPNVFTQDKDADDVVFYSVETAKEVLGIPALIAAEDILNCTVDEKSLITYLALFRSADRMLARGITLVSPKTQHKNDFVLRNGFHTSSKRLHHKPVDKRKSESAKNIAYGFGIRYGEVGKPTEFIVNLGQTTKSDLHISIKCTPDDEDTVNIKAEPRLKPIGDCSYIVSYTPVRSGFYEISVLCGHQHIHNSPFKIRVREPSVEFKYYKDAERGISIEPAKRPSDSDYLLFSDDSTWLLNNSDVNNNYDKTPYRPESLDTVDSGLESMFSTEHSTNNGLHSSAGSSERGSVITTYTSSPNSTSKGGSESSTFSELDFFEAFGPGLVSGEVGVMNHFEVRTPNGSNGPLCVLVTCPAVSIPTPYVNTRSDGDQLVHDVMFLPTEPGTYEIEIKWGVRLIAGSPYRVIVNEATDNQAEETMSNFDRFLNEDIRCEKKAMLFYSATSTDRRHARRKEYLGAILVNEISNLKLESVAVDLELSPNERRKLLSNTENRTLPLVYLDGKFLGDFNTLVGLYRRGLLTKHIDETFGHVSFKDSLNSGFVDVKTLREIKETLNELKHPT
eukprot:Seg806.3 transcript_id=Seg806.3/GoldUCD/mRNA.D3Y31 product=Filamin-C protein_id=Seg806.3/GoldUCD/D3Y31